MSTFGIVSGFFNPLHAGHIDYIKAASNLSDYLVVIVNNDLQVKLKGSKVFMDEVHRSIIVESVKFVDGVLISIDKDRSVAHSIENIYNYVSSFPSTNTYDDFVFYNSGDRDPDNENEKEKEVCDRLGIKRKYIDLAKRYSSSKLKESLN